MASEPSTPPSAGATSIVPIADAKKRMTAKQQARDITTIYKPVTGESAVQGLTEFGLNDKELNALKLQFEKWCKQDSIRHNLPTRLREVIFLLLSQPEKIHPCLDHLKSSKSISAMGSPREDTRAEVKMIDWSSIEKFGQVNRTLGNEIDDPLQLLRWLTYHVDLQNLADQLSRNLSDRVLSF